MATLTKGNFNIIWTSIKFQELFRSVVKPTEITPQFKTLSKSMNDKEILSELKPEDITLDELAYILENNLLKKDGFHVCYIKDSGGVLWSVSAHWLGGWFLLANYVGRPFYWDADDLVFSRGFSSPSDAPVNLGHPDTLTLKSAIKIVKDAGYKIVKEI